MLNVFVEYCKVGGSGESDDYVLLKIYSSEGSPTPKKPVYLGIAQNCDLVGLCGTIFLPKMRKFLKQQFWLWE